MEENGAGAKNMAIDETVRETRKAYQIMELLDDLWDSFQSRARASVAIVDSMIETTSDTDPNADGAQGSSSSTQKNTELPSNVDDTNKKIILQRTGKNTIILRITQPGGLLRTIYVSAPESALSDPVFLKYMCGPVMDESLKLPSQIAKQFLEANFDEILFETY